MEFYYLSQPEDRVPLATRIGIALLVTSSVYRHPAVVDRQPLTSGQINAITSKMYNT